jgi:adenylosuccinate lyase
MPDFDNYLSPFTWRYGTPEMRQLWSEARKRLLWRQVWVALAEVQAEYGLVTEVQAADLRAHMREIDLARAMEIEAEIQHDLMAEVRLFASQCPVGGGILHLGATSMDVEDNVDALRLRDSADLLLKSLEGLLEALSGQIEKWAELPVMAFTHLQPAEPSTLGYRLAIYGQDLLEDYQVLKATRGSLKGKGFKGAVGTGAAYAELLGKDHLDEFERKLSEKLGLPFFPVATQVYPRKQDYAFVAVLAGLGASLYKFAFDLRILQSPPIGELSEPFGERQVGSSAMPFKRNPIRSEKIDSLARYLASLPHILWDDAAHSLLERTLDDSANRRIVLPEACLAADELLRTATAIFIKLRVNEAAIARNMSIYGPFAATERVLMALVKAGADRQAMHERVRVHAMEAWEAVNRGEPNPLAERLCQDAGMIAYLDPQAIRGFMEAEAHTGNAEEKARAMARMIREELRGEM